MLDKGLTPHITEIPSFNVAGATFTFSRLGIDELFGFLRIFREILTWGAHDASKFAKIQFDKLGIQALGPVFYMGTPAVQNAIIKALADVILYEESGEVIGDDIRDANIFPLPGFASCFKYLALHPDLTGFLVILYQMAEDKELIQMMETLVEQLGGKTP